VRSTLSPPRAGYTPAGVLLLETLAYTQGHIHCLHGGRFRDTKMIFKAVSEIAHALPGVEESTMYGSPALKVRGKLLACMAIHKSAEPESLVIRIDIDQRAGLLTEAPETYYVTEHYVNYPVVLVRLSQIDRDQLRDLLASAWRFITAKSGRAGSVRPARANFGKSTKRLG
jgi:hypothetical protein